YVSVAIWEGQHVRAERNQKVDELRIAAQRLPAKLPKGQDVEITITYDTSRCMTVAVEIPLLGYRDEKTRQHEVEDVELDLAKLRAEVEELMSRATEYEQQASHLDLPAPLEPA